MSALVDPVEADLRRHLTAVDRAEAESEFAGQFIEDATAELLDDPAEAFNAISALAYAPQSNEKRSVADMLDDTGTPLADLDCDEWQRLLLCDYGHATKVLAGYRAWAFRVLEADADALGISKRAQALADEALAIEALGAMAEAA